ncbi:hypothetical protein RHOFW510R12_01460 [Rhodanobacter sp. FW510-R12]|uniref:hypothetical protein n=1 Tax=unclassified Rhodanobacter TaxID=2621553 RepID=UPI0007AA1401|nr:MULTISPECIES: hypothetical protein [unclassified Rhodanobacter]KZC17027.1 hypothetical protein RHOFW104R8_13380 [Rhodanobacter sp. FW104-R8]KZC28551.1 hypothetical protein RhoFW510T8_10620 [Rhodanobacter sp. FW510-T8]KZC32346.1 hypothetical protein RhoFW510R10_13005 [Rhodanobacter sp. FW510-R10]
MGIRESDRITAGLRYVAEEVSVHRDDFRRDQHPGGSALLEGCESLGYVQRGDGESGDRYAMTAAGLRRLAHAEPAPSAED